MTNKYMCINILHVCIYVQNLNFLHSKLCHVVQFRDQWAKKLTYNTNKNYNYNDYNNYNKPTTMKCDHLSIAEILAQLTISYQGRIVK